MVSKKAKIKFKKDSFDPKKYHRWIFKRIQEVEFSLFIVFFNASFYRMPGKKHKF